jgi:hypothetical protein
MLVAATATWVSRMPGTFETQIRQVPDGALLLLSYISSNYGLPALCLDETRQ